MFTCFGLIIKDPSARASYKYWRCVFWLHKLIEISYSCQEYSSRIPSMLQRKSFPEFLAMYDSTWIWVKAKSFIQTFIQFKIKQINLLDKFQGWLPAAIIIKAIIFDQFCKSFAPYTCNQFFKSQCFKKLWSKSFYKVGFQYFDVSIIGAIIFLLVTKPVHVNWPLLRY